MINIKTNYTPYIIVCILYIALSIIDETYPIGRLPLKAIYLSTWATLLIIELRKMIAQKKKGEITDYSNVVLIPVIMIIYIIDMFK